MTLFVVNRYVEDDIQPTEDHEEANLQRLKKLIEERRKAKSKAKLNVSEKVIEENVEVENEISIQSVHPIDHSKGINDSLPSVNEVLEAPSIVANEVIPQFKVLGTSNFEKKGKVRAVLPYWLSHPVPVSVNLRNLNTTVESLDYLDGSMKKKLLAEKIENLFPVQAQVIPFLLDENKKATVFWPRDMCVSAPTGSGKTLAYVLPIIQILLNRVGREVRALIILPVKELAKQVAKVFREYCIGTNLKVALVTGSVPFAQEQMQLLRYTESASWQSEVDIIVCTAGRLVEHLQFTEGFSLKNLRFLVMDEADRIMDHIQNDWLHHLNRHIHFESSIMTGKAPAVNFKTIYNSKRPPQKLFFSATLSQDPEKLKEWELFQPKLFSAVNNDCANNTSVDQDSIGRYTTPMELTEKYLKCGATNKPLVFYHLLKENKCDKVLCFTNSAQSAHRLTILMNHMALGEISVAEISSALSKVARETVLKKFQSGSVNVLISTDALARGIDVPNCDLVVSYDPPKNAKTYIHRVGRTGRAGNLGTAIAILVHDQFRPFQDVLKIIGKSDIDEIKIPKEVFENLSSKYNDAMVSSGEQIKEESSNQINKLKAVKRGRSNIASRKNKKAKY